MGERYGQLSLDERIEIYRLHEGGISRRKIAAAIGRSHTTVSRELRRNSVPTKAWRGGYSPRRAHALAARRRRWDGRFKLARQPDLRRLVKNGLAMGCSPEQIAGRLARDKGRHMISAESIYRYAYHRSAQKDYWHRLLPRRKARRGRPGSSGRQPGKLHQTAPAALGKTAGSREARPARPLGSRLHAVRKVRAQCARAARTTRPASPYLDKPTPPKSRADRTSHRLQTAPHTPDSCAKPSASTTAPSSPSTTAFTEASASRPSSATSDPHG